MLYALYLSKIGLRVKPGNILFIPDKNTVYLKFVYWSDSTPEITKQLKYFYHYTRYNASLKNLAPGRVKEEKTQT